MSNARSKLPVVARGLGLLIACAMAGRVQAYGADVWESLFGPSSDATGDWPRNLRVGAMVGFNLKGDFAMSGQFTVAGSDPGITGVAGQNHEYDDGYVRLDATGNYGGLTWNWGYENASQLTGQRLYFHSAQSFTATGNTGVSGDAQVGFDSAYGERLFPLWGGSLGWELGFGVLPIKIRDTQPMAASVMRVVHSFNASGIDSFPAPPYQGGYTGPSVTIDDTAAAEPGETVPAMLNGSRTIDVVLYNFRLGPTLQWELHPRLALAVSAGAAFGIASGGLEYDETLVFSDGSSAQNNGEVGETELVYGGYLAGILRYHAVKHGDLYLGLQYMPLTSATFSGDGREATLQMSGGLYFSVGLNWTF